MKRVILESPYAGDIEANLAYARRAVRHSLSLGEAPIASHLLYTQDGILKDSILEERRCGIEAGLAWLEVADLQVFYMDRGMSFGMRAALPEAGLRKVRFRWLFQQVPLNWRDLFNFYIPSTACESYTSWQG